MRLLRDRFTAAASGPARGMEKIEAIGRAYMGYANEFPHYFDFCSRFQAHARTPDAGTNEGSCQRAGDEVMNVVVQAIDAGLRDGSIRGDVGEPLMLAITLWAFTHGVIQLAMTKGADLARYGIAVPDFSDYALHLIRSAAQANPAT